MGLPDFLCAGAQKAGTSWLNNVLLEHPQIFMPPINELHFFDRLDDPDGGLRPRQINLARKAVKRERAKGDAADEAYLDYLQRLVSFPGPSIEWYRAAFSWPVAEDVKTGDITPAYLELEEQHIRYAHELLGPVRLILIVRRPADRLLSQLRMWATRLTRADVPRDEREWMALLQEMTTKTSRGSYRGGVSRRRAIFGDDSMLALPYSEMKTNPRGLIDRVEAHLGLARYEHYTLLKEQIHVTQKLDIPASVVRAVAELTEDEDDFIRKEFGEEFYQKTR